MSSLLIPTENDRIDAHGDTAGEEAYRELYANELKSQTIDGRLVYPWEFEVVPGFFKQSDPETDDLAFNYAVDDFGRTKQWSEICDGLRDLNSTAPSNVCYKLIFFARHGQGFHNMCVEKYGIEEWNRYWHAQLTDGEITFAPDPPLTPLGLSQADENNEAWKDQIEKGAPIPQEFYVLPLQRSSNTLVNTWKDIRPPTQPVIVREGIRETCGKNMCDKRSTKTVIKERFEKYGFVVGDDITENDELFKVDYRETLPEHCTRLNQFLQKLFDRSLDSSGKISKDKAYQSTYISTTSHAGTIRSMIVVLGHRHFTISTGGMIPIVVKATRRE